MARLGGDPVVLLVPPQAPRRRLVLPARGRPPRLGRPAQGPALPREVVLVGRARRSAREPVAPRATGTSPPRRAADGAPRPEAPPPPHVAPEGGPVAAPGPEAVQADEQTVRQGAPPFRREPEMRAREVGDQEEEAPSGRLAEAPREGQTSRRVRGRVEVVAVGRVLLVVRVRVGWLNVLVHSTSSPSPGPTALGPGPALRRT